MSDQLRTSAADLRAGARRQIKARHDVSTYIDIWGALMLRTAIWFCTTPSAYFWPVWPVFVMDMAALFIGRDASGVGRRYYPEADVDAEIERMTGRSKGRGFGRLPLYGRNGGCSGGPTDRRARRRGLPRALHREGRHDRADRPAQHHRRRRQARRGDRYRKHPALDLRWRLLRPGINAGGGQN